jgi:alcohol dehydrogenase/propanol-preferring alcohol dehydrogenase
MLSYQTAGPGEPLQRTENDTPVPDGREVLLKTVACGVCHSDIHLHESYFDLGDGKKLSVGGPGMILGHEIFGEVVAVGPNADGSAVGDRRVVYPYPYILRRHCTAESVMLSRYSCVISFV